MVKRTLPGSGLTAFWPLGDNTYKPEMDENFLLLSALTGMSVVSRTTDPLPGSPTDPDYVYIVDSGAASNANSLAVWDGESGSEQWNYFAPSEGMVFFVEDEGINIQFSGGSWGPFSVNASGISQPAELTGSHTLTNSDLAGNVFRRVDSAAPVNITVAASLTGTEPCTFVQVGAGALTFVEDTGVTILSLEDNLVTAGPGAFATLIPDHDTADLFYLTGGLTS